MIRHIPLFAIVLCFALGGTAAKASHPQAGQMSAVKSLAHELEKATDHLHREAERRAHHGDRYEARALEAFHRLENRAGHFHREVERYYADPYHTEKDFRRLEKAYWEAVHDFGYLHGQRHVERDWQRVRQLMSDLTFYYRGEERRGDRGHYRRQSEHGHREPYGFRLWFDWRR